MKHLFENSDGEIVAADTAEQASQYHDVELSGVSLNADEWDQLPDGAVIPFVEEDDPKKVIRRTNREWAEEYETPEVHSTTYT